ncbi:hypothetical protein LX36DRAFT_754093 [Colletotrichum falcatum]|nr:hypothetical protein LX36DRAFT_754093 [Colletotrichum falcatum]
MKASVLPSLIVAMAGVLLTASPAAAFNCAQACFDKCKSEGKSIVSFGGFSCSGSTITNCPCQ